MFCILGDGGPYSTGSTASTSAVKYPVRLPLLGRPTLQKGAPPSPWFRFFDVDHTCVEFLGYMRDLPRHLRTRIRLDQRLSEVYGPDRRLIVALHRAEDRLTEGLLDLAQIDINLLAPPVDNNPNLPSRIAKSIEDLQ